MRYQDSQNSKSTILSNILTVVNFLLLAIIAISVNYLVINFLF